MNIDRIVGVRFPLVLLMIIVTLLHTQVISSQVVDADCYELEYRIDRVYPSFCIGRESLRDVKSLYDLNERYESEWIKEYIKVELSAMRNGSWLSAVGENALLTREQRELIKNADYGSSVKIEVEYIPQNDLKDNEAKFMEFEVKIEAENPAEFPGGETALGSYLESNLASIVPATTFNQYQMAAATFTINKSGEVEEVRIHSSSGSTEVDKLILKTIENMPVWIPARYADGMAVEQNFVLRAGDMTSCISNLFNLD